jgi:hypothetical protein
MLIALVLACSPADPPLAHESAPQWEAVGEGFIPGELELTVSGLVAGATGSFEVTGALMGDEVHVLASIAGTGDGPCPDFLMGVCLDLLPGIRDLGTDSAGFDGSASVNRMMPESLAGEVVCAQAVVRRAADVATSAAVCVPVVAELHWYTTCGDPVCSGWTPVPGVPMCTTEVEGETCADPSGLCDLGSFCNEKLTCAESDPRAAPGGCPISKAEHKRDIDHLSTHGIDRMRDEALALKLASWNYLDDDPTQATRLGFLIDDRPHSPAIFPNGEQVDLYGYTSLAIAAIQSQQRTIDALQLRIQHLEALTAAAP